jgi:hydroxyacylglutathione hydrolase
MFYTDTINKIRVHQLLIDNGLDNFSYIIENSRSEGIIIDPASSDEVETVLQNNGINPVAIINTHSHQDHIAGNSYFIKKYNLPVWADSELLKKYRWEGHGVIDGDFFDKFEEGCVLKFLHTPGHTECGIVLFARLGKDSMIFTGDTLFAGGVGNCKNGGNQVDLYNSILKIISNCSDNTVIYPGHNYLKHNLEFRDSILGSSIVTNDLKSKLGKKKRIKTTLELEKEVNIFLQCDNLFVKKAMEESDALGSFIKLREFKDNF